MLKIPRIVGLNFKMNSIGLNFKMIPRQAPRIFVQSGFERMLVFPGISKADILGDAENPTFYRAQL